MAGSRKLIVLLFAAVGLLAAAPGADARAPEMVSADQSGGHVRVSWSLPLGVYSATVEISNSPKLDSDGFFTNGDYFGEPDMGDEQFTTPEAFPPGTYWVHAGGLDLDGHMADPDCDECPDIEFTKVAKVDVPAAGSGTGTSAPGSGPLTKIPVLRATGKRCKHKSKRGKYGKRCAKRHRDRVKARTALEPLR